MKEIIGVVEKVSINGKELLAKIDTGATRNSIDFKLASELKLGPIIKTVKIKNSNGKQVRPVVEAEIVVKDKKMKTFFNLSNRRDMKYSVLIGKETIKDFLVDPGKDETSSN